MPIPTMAQFKELGVARLRKIVASCDFQRIATMPLAEAKTSTYRLRCIRASNALSSLEDEARRKAVLRRTSKRTSAVPGMTRVRRKGKSPPKRWLK